MKKIDSIGRVMLPKDMREDLNITENTNLKLEVCEGYLKITPTECMYKISKADMLELRKIYIALKQSGLLDEHYIEVLSRITNESNVKCEKCNCNMFVDDKSYRCYNCD